MAFSTGGGGGAMGEINVTPMIDILLVLLIIFMVIVPVPQGPGRAGAAAAQESKSSSSRTTAPSWFRCSIAPVQPRRTRSTRPTLQARDLLAKLTEIYANRAERVMFVKGDDDVNFRYIADVIDIGKAANVDHIGLMTPKILAGQ